MNSDHETRLEQLEAMLIHLADQNVAQEARIVQLEQQIISLLPASKLPFAERLPDESSITKVHADLFHNPDAKQGSPKYDLKVFIWLDNAKGRDGSISPLHYHMSFAKYTDLTFADNLLGKVWRTCNTTDAAMIGAIVHQGAHAKGKGKVKLSDQVASIVGDELCLFTPGFMVDLGKPDPAKAVTKAKAPIRSWTWHSNRA